jgi:hypothetical protein
MFESVRYEREFCTHVVWKRVEIGTSVDQYYAYIGEAEYLLRSE